MPTFQQPRRKFLQVGAAGIIISFFAGLPKIGFAKARSNNNKAILVHEEEGLHILTGRRKVPMNIKISKTKDGVNELSFCVEDMTPGRKMRVHKHLRNDELIFVHKG